MIRLLFIPFLVLFLFSCEGDSKEVDPLFYQISVVDSTRCMNEILGEIREQAKENQKRQDEFDGVHMICCLMSRDHMQIRINSRGELRNNCFSDSVNVEEKVFKYFMFNRTLTSRETQMGSMDSNHPGYDFPFYNKFSLEEIQHRIKETQNDADEVKSVDGVDPVLVEYYASKVDEWKLKLRSLELIGGKTLDQISPQAIVSVEYEVASEKSEEVLNQVAFAFYQMRNYECIRYFNETYISLYDRASRRKRKRDLDKLDALVALHPASILDHDDSKSPPPMELQAPLPPKNR